jgi:hypothetical protein
MLLVAEDLVDRAQRLLEYGNSVEEFIHGAVLATDALELVGNRTPTVAIAALNARHELELSAECSFFGLRSNLEVSRRLEAIHREIEWIARRFHYETRSVSALETEVTVLITIVKMSASMKKWYAETWRERAAASSGSHARIGRALWLGPC